MNNIPVIGATPYNNSQPLIKTEKSIPRYKLSHQLNSDTVSFSGKNDSSKNVSKVIELAEELRRKLLRNEITPKEFNKKIAELNKG